MGTKTIHELGDLPRGTVALFVELARDGTAIYSTRNVEQSDIWMLEP